MSGRETDRKTEGELERQKERERGRKTDRGRETPRNTGGEGEKQIERQRDRQTEGELKERQTEEEKKDRWNGNQIEGMVETQTDRQRDEESATRVRWQKDLPTPQPTPRLLLRPPVFLPAPTPSRADLLHKTLSFSSDDDT